MEEKIYNIILHKDVDYDSFWNDMETITNLDNIPNREVGVANRREASYRQTWYYLTEEEKELVEQHSNVLAVEIPPEFRDDIVMGHTRIQSGSFSRTPSSARRDDNYGLLRVSSAKDMYRGNYLVNEKYKYTLDGTGVDIVIHDSGVAGGHPDFLDDEGSNRLVNTDWAALSGLSLSNSANNNTDTDGHGTHVAGIAAGKVFGHAKNAMIYPLKVNGLQGDGDTSGISSTNSFDCVKLWHRNKPIDPATGFKRPTVVNMSWQFYSTIGTGNRDVFFRGASTSSIDTTQARAAGVNPYTTNEFRVPYRLFGVDTDIYELIEEGIHVCIAAGNENLKIDLSDGIDYNNTVSTGLPRYYHRGGSPYYSEAFNVGATQATQSGSLDSYNEVRAQYSNHGPGVDIYAPGSGIISSTPVTSAKGGNTYRLDDLTNYKQAVLNGTSMASPQVAGVVAIFCQANPGANPATIKKSVLANATDLLHNPSTTDLYTFNGLHGSPQRFLRNIYAGKDHNIEFSGDLIPPFEYLS